MYSASIEMLKIGNLKVKFSLVLLDTENPNEKTDPKKRGNPSVVSKMKKGENQYLKFQSKGRVILELVTDGNWSITNQIGFTRSHFYPFLRKLRQFVSNFQIQNLFSYGLGNRLMVNKELADQYRLTHQTTNRACTMEYCVVHDPQNQEVEYEGCLLCINQRGNFLTLTYEELCTLVEVLNRVDFDNLSMHLIEAAKLYESLPAKEFGGDSYIISQQPQQDPTIYRGPSRIETPNLFP